MRTVNAIIAPSLNSRLLYFTLVSSLILAPVAATVHALFYVFIAGVLTIPQLVNGVLLAALFVLLAAVRSPAGRGFSLFGPLLFLAFYAAVLSAVVSEPFMNLKETVRMLFPCAVGMASYILAARGELSPRVLVRIAWWVLAACIASQMAAYAMGTTLYENAYAVSDVGGQGGSSITVVMIAPLFFLSGQWRKRDMLGILVAVASVCATMRRSGILAMFALLLVCIVCRISKRQAAAKDKVYSFLIPVAVSILFLYALTATGWGNAFSDRLADLDFAAGGTGSGRTVLLAIGWDHLTSRGPVETILGEGRACALEISYAKFRNRIGTHNEWLAVVLSYGVVGSLAYIVFHWKVAILILRLRKAPLGLFEASAASLVAIVVVAATCGDVVMVPTVSPLFALLGYAAAMERCRHRDIDFGQRYLPTRGRYYRAR